MAKHDLEQRLMRRLVDGVAGWAAYYQACGAGRHYGEHLFYPHIEEIGRGRDWRVSQQHQLIGTGGRGAPPSVDFIFSRLAGEAKSRAGMVFVEVKYLRGDNPSQDLEQLRRDIVKLRGLDASGLRENKRLLQCGEPARFLLICAQEAGLDAVGSCLSRANGAIAKMVGKARDGNRRNVYRASMQTYLKTSLEWVVLGIGESRWPDLS
jgi:hypothetical protein